MVGGLVPLSEAKAVYREVAGGSFHQAKKSLGGRAAALIAVRQAVADRRLEMDLQAALAGARDGLDGAPVQMELGLGLETAE